MNKHTMIRRHFQTEVEHQAEINWAEIEERLEDDPVFAAVKADRRWTRSALALGAAFLVVLALAVPALLQDPATNSVAETPDPTTFTTVVPSSVVPQTTSPAPTTTSPAPAMPVFAEWTRVDGPEGARADGTLTTDPHGFVFISRSNWIATSTDGATWEKTDRPTGPNRSNGVAYWDGIVMSWGGGGATGVEGQPIVANPSFVHVSHPDGSSSSFSIDGDITAAAIGGRGMLVMSVNNNYDHMILLQLTPEEEEMLGGSGIEDGILTAEFTDGTTRSVDLAELGIDPNDIDKVDGWFSDDGEIWVPIASETPQEIWNLVGTNNGFYAQSFGDTTSGIWYTVDGHQWTKIETGQDEGSLTSSGDNVIWLQPNGYQILTPTGTRPGSSWDELPVGSLPVAIGKHGVLSLQMWDEQTSEMVVRPSYAPNGESFGPVQVPDEMAQANVWGIWTPMTAVVRDRYLLMLFEGDFEPSFWIRDFDTS